MSGGTRLWPFLVVGLETLAGPPFLVEDRTLKYLLADHLDPDPLHAGALERRVIRVPGIGQVGLCFRYVPANAAELGTGTRVDDGHSRPLHVIEGVLVTEPAAMESVTPRDLDLVHRRTLPALRDHVRGHTRSRGVAAGPLPRRLRALPARGVVLLAGAVVLLLVILRLLRRRSRGRNRAARPRSRRAGPAVRPAGPAPPRRLPDPAGSR